MPHTITKTVFNFDELSDSAKDKAREWYRNASAGDSFFAESVIDDAVTCAKLIGIDIDRRPARTASGTPTLGEPKVYWSGFSSQGDGACFEGNYRYVKGSVKAIAKHAPKDTELQRIARELYRIQKQHFYSLSAECSQSGHYSHSGCMRVNVSDSRDERYDLSEAEDDVTQALRDFADWIYRQLEKEYEWSNADAQVDANICANEYTFDVDGNRED